MHSAPDLASRSPWSDLHEYTVAEISPGERSERERVVSIPGSKSLTNRALLLAALARGTSRVSGILKGDDSYWCIESLRQLGVRIEVEGDTAVVHGEGGQWPIREGRLYVGSAGTVSRFLPGLLVGCEGGHWTVEGSASMSRRPLGTLIESLQELGAAVEYLGKPGHLPLRIGGQPLRGGEVSISGKVSSQFLSGLMIAAVQARTPVTLQIADHVVQQAYLLMTIDTLRDFGARVVFDTERNRITVDPSLLQGRDYPLEADVSASCYFMALAALDGGRVRILNLPVTTRQPDIGFLQIMEQMGCISSRDGADLLISGPEKLRGGFTVSMRELSDQALTLAALAPFADGPITVTGVEHIRAHECDRVAAGRICLEQLGVKVEEHRDGWTIHPGPIRPVPLDSFDDHRVAMSMALIGAAVPGITISDPGCVSKTFPEYFRLLGASGPRVTLRK